MKKQDILNFIGLTEKEFYKEYKNPEDFFNSSLGKKFMAKNGGSFKPHMMYDPKTKKGKKAKTYKEHLALKKKGWEHTAPKAQVGNLINFNNLGQTNYMEDTAAVADSFLQQENPTLGLTPLQQSNQQTLSQLNNANVSESAGMPSMNTLNQVTAGLQGLGNFAQESKQEGKNRDVAKQRVRTLRPQYTAVQSTARENERVQKENLENLYSRPQAVTGEAFFPTMGVGKNGGTYKAQDGGTFTGEYMPLIDPNETKQFQGGGFVYGGGPAGQIGSSLGQMVAGENSNALGRFSGNVLGTAGTALAGPIGGAVGQFIGNTVIGSFDKRVAETQRYNKQSNRLINAMTNTISGQDIHSGLASTKNGGSVSSYKNGGSEKMSSNPSMLDTMAMDGSLKTLWGGEAETVSYNPYTGGESIMFKGNSHKTRDSKTAETGIGIAYGDGAMMEPEGGMAESGRSSSIQKIEVEGGEPAYESKDKNGKSKLNIIGDMFVMKELLPLINDDRAKGKKMKNFISKDVYSDEMKADKLMLQASKIANGSDIDDSLSMATAKTKKEAAEMIKKKAASTKEAVSNVQELQNYIFDALGADANKFIKTGKLVKDPMRIENSKVENSKYGKNIHKAKNGPPNELELNELPDEPKVFDSVEEAEKAGFSYNQEKDRWEKETSKGTESAELSIEALEEVRKGQGENKETGLFGNVTIEQFEESKKANPWFDWEKFDPNNEADVTRYQEEFNRRAKESGDPTRLQIDGRFGEQTASARFSQAQEATQPDYEVANVTESEEPLEENVVQPQIPMLNFRQPVDDIPFDSDQIGAEIYAAMTNRLPERNPRKYIETYRTPYEISLQDMKNDVVSQSRALQRNPALQDNPAALALAQAPTYEALNKINAEEFRQNQQMKDAVYSSNIDAMNKANLLNLNRYDRYEDMRVGDQDATRRQNIQIIDSMARKRAQNELASNTNQVLKGMYPNLMFDDNYQVQVAQGTQFNTGQTNTGIAPFISGGGFGGGQTMQQLPGIIGGLQSIFGNQGQSDEEEESAPAKYGKKVTKNNKNSNILKAIRNL